MLNDILKTAVCAVILSVCSLQSLSADDWRSQVSIESADLSIFHMVLINDGKESGSMTYGWHKDGDTYVVADRTEMLPNIQETAKAIIDAKTLLPVSVAIDFAIGENSLDIDIRWQDGKRTGQFVSTRDGQSKTNPVDIVEESPVLLRMAVIGMAAAFPITDTFEVSLPWYNTLANKVETITLKTVGSETVETPAGTYDTYKIALQGGSPENILYISKSQPRKIVRIDVVGQPMHFLLTD